MKVWRLVFLVGALLLLEALGAHADAWGDIDGDGTLTILDVRLCHQMWREIIPCPGDCAEFDVNGDGIFDDYDCWDIAFELVTSPPEIDVQRPAGTRIYDGGTDAVGNYYPPGTATVDLRYTVANTSATALLRISEVTASGLSNCSGFTVATDVPLSVPAGEAATLDVSFDVDSVGPFSLDLEITNNDPNESRYDIHIVGRRCHLVVSFDDPQLEAAVRDAVDKPTGLLYACDVEPLTVLDARDRGISDLTGIDQLIGLQSLDLSANDIVDITPLAGLTGLQTLKLGRNAIVDITPLAGLTALQTLELYTNGITAIGALANLVNLRVLQLAENAFTTIDVLTALTGLEALGLGGNAIAGFEPLESLTNLEYLDLEETGIADIGVLAGLVNLRTLYMFYNNISDISPLKDLTDLEKLDLGANPGIGDIGPLADLKELVRLHADWISVADIGPLEDLTNLTYLDLGWNWIVDIDALDELTALTSLRLDGNNIANIDALVRLTALTYLDLADNDIVGIGALAGLTAITRLILEYNQIVDIEALVANSVAGGLGPGDKVELRSNPLGAQACADVVTLRSNGVTVDEDTCPP